MDANGRSGLSTTISRATLVVALTCGALQAAAQTPQGQISGTVTDSIHGRPLAGATIIATPTANLRDSVFHSATSDSHGRFRLADLQAGRYAITTEHPYADSIGVGTLPVQIDVPTAGIANVALSIPSAATLRRALCPAAVLDTTLGVVLGTVRRLDGSVARGANVVLKWSDFDVDRTSAAVTQREISAVAATDSTGIYRACGVPVARTLFMQAQQGTTTQTGVLEARVDEAGVLVRDLTLAQDYALAAKTTERRTFSLRGRIASASGKPVASAQVRLFGVEQGASTNEAGEFRLNGLPGGTQGLEVLALGYAPRRMRVEISDDTPPVAITMENSATVLDSVRIVAARTKRTQPAYEEFEHRRKNGFGRFISEEEIEKRHAFKTSDLLTAFPGFSGGGMDSNGGSSLLADRVAPTRQPPCHLQVFIDGVELGGALVDINIVPPSAIHGIELHDVATAPVKYRVGACGALFIWTK
jgi:hypothetical protein